MTGYAIAYAVQLFGGLAMIMSGAFWAMKNPRQKDESLVGVRRRWMVVILLGGLLVIEGFFGLLRL